MKEVHDMIEREKRVAVAGAADETAGIAGSAAGREGAQAMRRPGAASHLWKRD